MSDSDLPCMACDTVHPQGHCRLKLAGVEHCGLCGIAHFGHSRTCPHLNSEMQVAQMLGSLKESTEQRALVEEATKYIRGIRGDLVFRRKKKLKAARDRGDGMPQHQTAMPPPIPSQHAQGPYDSAYTTAPQSAMPSSTQNPYTSPYTSQQHREMGPRQHPQHQPARRSLPRQHPQHWKERQSFKHPPQYRTPQHHSTRPPPQ